MFLSASVTRAVTSVCRRSTELGVFPSRWPVPGFDRDIFGALSSYVWLGGRMNCSRKLCPNAVTVTVIIIIIILVILISSLALTAFWLSKSTSRSRENTARLLCQTSVRLNNLHLVLPSRDQPPPLGFPHRSSSSTPSSCGSWASENSIVCFPHSPQWCLHPARSAS